VSNNLALSQVAAAQNQKEVTINDQAGELDAAISEVDAFLVDDGNALTLTDEQSAATSPSICSRTVPARTPPSL
jgi:hypothetical protein